MQVPQQGMAAQCAATRLHAPRRRMKTPTLGRGSQSWRGTPSWTRWPRRGTPAQKVRVLQASSGMAQGMAARLAAAGLSMRSAPKAQRVVCWWLRPTAVAEILLPAESGAVADPQLKGVSSSGPSFKVRHSSLSGAWRAARAARPTPACLTYQRAVERGPSRSSIHGDMHAAGKCADLRGPPGVGWACARRRCSEASKPSSSPR